MSEFILESQAVHQNIDNVNKDKKLKYSTTSTIFAQQSITNPDISKLMYRWQQMNNLKSISFWSYWLYFMYTW